jgi:hypothetical protein
MRCKHHGPTRPATGLTPALLLTGLGFVSCGLTWLFVPLPLIAAVLSPRCPVCGGALYAETP